MGTEFSLRPTTEALPVIFFSLEQIMNFTHEKKSVSAWGQDQLYYTETCSCAFTMRKSMDM